MRLAALCSTLLSLVIAGTTLSVAGAQEAATALPVARIAVHAARLLDGLVDVGSVTTAAESAPDRALNLAFTAAGLRRLTESAAR